MICMNDPKKKSHVDMVTLGERGQVVIPAAIREQLELNAGDRMMVFSKHNEMVCLVPASNMRHMLEVLTSQLEEIENTDNQEV